jgi:hypothetical protein
VLHKVYFAAQSVDRPVGPPVSLYVGIVPAAFPLPVFFVYLCPFPSLGWRCPTSRKVPGSIPGGDTGILQ